MKRSYLSFSRIGIVLSFAAYFLLASCSDNATPASAEAKEAGPQKAAAAKGACALLTEADAKKVIGNEIQAGMQTPTMCQYVSASQELSKTGENVSLTLHKGAASEFDKYLVDTETSTGIKPQPVTGVGQKAAWADGSLIVQQGEDLLVIIVGKKMEQAPHLALAKDLAVSILSRM